MLGLDVKRSDTIASIHCTFIEGEKLAIIKNMIYITSQLFRVLTTWSEVLDGELQV